MVTKKQTVKLSHQRFVIGAGYTLFAVTLIGVVVSTVIPFATILTRMTTNNHFNVTVLLLALVAGALLPMIIGYFIGDAGTRSKNKGLHHYNGILFGLLAYWIALLLSYLTFIPAIDPYVGLTPAVYAIIVNAVPIVGSAIVVSILAYLYHRKSAKRQGLVVYRPFQVLFLIAALGATVILPVIQLASQMNGIFTIAYNLAILVVVVLGWIVLRNVKASKLGKLTLALIGVSFALFTSYAVLSLISTLPLYETGIYDLTLYIGSAVGLVVLAVYLAVTRKSLR